MKKRAFTLIELLVVIAIIALLLAILLPSLKKVKQIARDVICRSNQRQWSLIWGMYTDENDGKFPYASSGLMPRGQWIEALRSEWQTEGDIIRCPSATKFKVYKGDMPHGSYTTTYEMDYETVAGQEEIKEKCSYGMNVWAYSEHPTSGFLLGNDKNYWQRITVRSGSNIPMFMDSMWRGARPGYPDEGEGDMIMPSFEDDTNDWSAKGVGGGIRHFAMPRHGSGAKAGINVLFFDLSARHVMIKELWTLKWHKNFNTNAWSSNPSTYWPTWMDKYSEDF